MWPNLQNRQNRTRMVVVSPDGGEDYVTRHRQRGQRHQTDGTPINMANPGLDYRV